MGLKKVLKHFKLNFPMPAKSIEPLKKVTVDLFADDVDYIQSRDWVFAETIREAIRELVTKHKKQVIEFSQKPEPFTIGDLEHD